MDKEIPLNCDVDLARNCGFCPLKMWSQGPLGRSGFGCNQTHVWLVICLSNPPLYDQQMAKFKASCCIFVQSKCQFNKILVRLIGGACRVHGGLELYSELEQKPT